METFTTASREGTSLEIEYNNLTPGFKEGLNEMEDEKGINNIAEKWSVSVGGYLQDVAAILAFFRRHKSTTPFLWTNPLGETIKVKASDVSVSSNGPMYMLVSTDFTQVFRP